MSAYVSICCERNALVSAAICFGLYKILIQTSAVLLGSWNEHDVFAGDLPFLSPGFLTIGRHKLDLIKTLLSYKVNLVLSDVDTGQSSLYDHSSVTIINFNCCLLLHTSYGFG